MSGPLEERDEQQFYASERLKDCQHMILRMAQSLVVQRARVEKARSAGLAAARDAYSDLQEVRGYLLEALSDVRPCLMEVEEYKLAAAAGQLHAGLAHFDLMSTAYKPVYDALCGFAGSLPVSGTTNAAVVGRLMNNIKLGYYPTDPDNTAGWTEAEFNAQIENTRSQITELREKISDAIIYISKRTELTFAPLKLNRVAISLYDIVKSTGERKDAFRFTYQAEGCTKGRLYKCLSHSERLRAGMEVSEMVKRLTGRNYPVFADDMESIEDLSNVKPTGQVIMARVVPHAPLSVQPLQPIQASAQAQAA